MNHLKIRERSAAVNGPLCSAFRFRSLDTRREAERRLTANRVFDSAVHSCVSERGANFRLTVPEATTGVVLDSSRAPLYVVRFPVAVTDAQLARIFIQFQELLRRQQVIGVICDVSHSSLSPVQRKQVALEMSREGRHYARWVAGWALIVQSTVARGTLTALTWIAAPPFDLKVFGEFAGAEAWAAERLLHVQCSRGMG